MLKSAIFDLDGTLCESMAVWRAEATDVDFHDRVATEELYARMREHYHKDFELRAGVIPFLQKLRENNIRCCIASATAADVSKPLMDKSGLMQYMDFYVSTFDIGKRKDCPDIYLYAAQRLGSAPAECAVFEDSEYCARTAKNAGFFVVGVYDPTTSQEGHAENYSDFYVREFTVQTAELFNNKSAEMK